MSDAANTLKVFCSYSHKDEEALSELRTHLSSLRYAKLIDDWHDRKIPTGGDWSQEIAEALDAADLVLLLISSDFVHSNYCMEVETARAIQRHDAGEATVIPIFLRECVINGLPFARIQGTPRDMRWINQRAHRDKAWAEVAGAIRDAAMDRLGPAQNDYAIKTLLSNSVAEQETESGGKGRPLARPWLVGLLVLVVMGVVGLYSWQWFFPNDVLSTQGRRALQQGEYALAKQHCNEAPSSYFKGQCREVVALALNQPASQDAFFTAASAQGSAYADVLMGSYQLREYYDGNESTLNEAEEHFRAALQADDQLAEAHFSLGLIDHFRNRPQEALPHYRKAQTIADNNNTRYALNIATALADAEQFPKAQQALSGVLTTAKFMMIAHAELIEVLVKQGKLDEARQAITTAQILLDTEVDLAKKPDNSANWFALQDGQPSYIKGWPQKLAYLQHYIFKLVEE